MKILIAVDQGLYSDHAVLEGARIAKNTWAHVTILGVKSSSQEADNADETDTLIKYSKDYRQQFLKSFEKDFCPYPEHTDDYELIEKTPGVFVDSPVLKNTQKELKTVVRTGNPIKEIFAEAREGDYDLIIIGCSGTNECVWENDPMIPQRIVNDASCSVLVAKDIANVKKIICCLDHNQVSQESIEMINQLVTFHDAELEIVGIAEGDSLKDKVENKIQSILKYYTAKHIATPEIEVVSASAFESFISARQGTAMLALWMEKKSFLAKIFSKTQVTKLIKESHSSVMILR